MKVFLLGIIVFCASLATADDHLMCYVCGGTEEACSKDKMKVDDSNQMICSAGENKCIRTWTKKDDITLVGSLCGNDAMCEKLKDVCDDEGNCGVSCCDKDLCNAGSPVSFCVFLIAFCSAVGLALLK